VVYPEKSPCLKLWFVAEMGMIYTFYCLIYSDHTPLVKSCLLIIYVDISEVKKKEGRLHGMMVTLQKTRELI
jgi:hypothetical protein